MNQTFTGPLLSERSESICIQSASKLASTLGASSCPYLTFPLFADLNISTADACLKLYGFCGRTFIIQLLYSTAKNDFRSRVGRNEYDSIMGCVRFFHQELCRCEGGCPCPYTPWHANAPTPCKNDPNGLSAQRMIAIPFELCCL